MSNFYTNPNTCEQHPVASCGGCGTPAPKPCKTCPRCPVLCPETCQQPTCGISQPRVGLQERYIVGLGNEDRINTNGLVANTEFNSIPWYWLAESTLDASAPFTAKRYDRCDGKYFEAPDRNTYHFKNPNGTIIKTWKNPFSTLNALAGITLNLTDTAPVLNENVLIPAGDAIQFSAGAGIDLVPLANGVRIVNTSIIEPTTIQRVNNSGLTLTGTGTSTNPYLIGIDCGTLSLNCGLVKSVNGVTPDENGNVVVSGGSSGITNILPDVANIISFTPTSSGILQTNFNCSNLKTSCNLLDTSSLIPLSRIAQSGATTGQIPVWNGTNWVAQTPASGSTTVQYQEEGTNTGTTNPTVVNFTGSGVTASQSGSVVTVNVPGGAAVLNQGFNGRYLGSGTISIPANSQKDLPVSKTATVLQVFNNPTPSLFTVNGTAITFNQSGEYLFMMTPYVRTITNSNNSPLYPIEIFSTYALPGSTLSYGAAINTTLSPLFAISGGIGTSAGYNHIQVVSVAAGQTMDNITWNMQKTSAYTNNATIDMNLFEFSIGIYKLK